MQGRQAFLAINDLSARQGASRVLDLLKNHGPKEVAGYRGITVAAIEIVLGAWNTLRLARQPKDGKEY